VITNREIFPDTKEYLPVLLIASADANSSTGANIAVPMMKALVLDTEDLDLAAFIYQMIFGNFNMFFTEDDPDFITYTPFNV